MNNIKNIEFRVYEYYYDWDNQSDARNLVYCGPSKEDAIKVYGQYGQYGTEKQRAFSPWAEMVWGVKGKKIYVTDRPIRHTGLRLEDTGLTLADMVNADCIRRCSRKNAHVKHNDATPWRSFEQIHEGDLVVLNEGGFSVKRAVCC